MPKLQGFDVSVTIVGDNGPDLVGEYQEVEFTIKEDSESYLALGERIAEILDGQITIEGKLKRGHTQLDIINRIWGAKALKRGEKIPSAPRFAISFNVDAPGKGFSGKYRLLACKIDELAIKAQSGKNVVSEDLSFKAEGIEPVK
ncbi:hypothetical protein [Desulfitobacterium chlororespirans]|uniref:Uncharacterized protein n=1 Tax=Desulfitobacterium chlororespirans DSM 11544 TaxID=1121395 RepID=A0A1M7TR22_9FIRM|nr:hypothetical protein [Desulfitobacterium chlororespirans]SHN73155.1 hypothetical protein SAMN02745215_02415 [Desulfitobacterium chlororespirans DSM 11544]